MKSYRSRVGALGAVAALAISLCGFAPAAGTASAGLGSAEPAGEVAIGAPLGDALLLGLNGPSRRLAQLRGKPLLINVWASWCGPCKQETASLERLAWLEGVREFNIIGISTDDDPQRARDWLADSHATISQFIDTDLRMEHRLGASRLPLTVLVGADGRVLEKIYGAREWDSAPARALLHAAWARAGAARPAGPGPARTALGHLEFRARRLPLHPGGQTQEAVDLIGNHKLLEGQPPRLQPARQIHGLLKAHVAVVIPLDEQHRGAPLRHRGVGR